MPGTPDLALARTRPGRRRLVRRLPENAQHTHDSIIGIDIAISSEICQAESVLAPEWLLHQFDSALTHKARLMEQVKLDSLQHDPLIERTRGAQIRGGLIRTLDLIRLAWHQTPDDLTHTIRALRITEEEHEGGRLDRTPSSLSSTLWEAGSGPGPRQEAGQGAGSGPAPILTTWGCLETALPGRVSPSCDQIALAPPRDVP